MSDWRTVARHATVGLHSLKLDDFAPVFEHEQMSTVRRMEQGDLRVPLHFFTRALHIFGEVERLANLLDTAQDDIGLTLMDEQLRELTELDFVLAVDDFSRIGALRLQDRAGTYCRTVEQGQRTTPAMLELQHMFEASRAVETGTESADDLRYLVGKSTSLGGMRPKCTVIDNNGLLAIGKFPSVDDTRSVTRGEVLALRLARLAGIDTAPARIVEIDGVAAAIIERFDRTPDSARIPYLSAASMLQASRQHEHSYTEITDATHCARVERGNATPARPKIRSWRYSGKWSLYLATNMGTPAATAWRICLNAISGLVANQGHLLSYDVQHRPPSLWASSVDTRWAGYSERLSATG